MKINLLPKKIITPVPPELKEQFDDMLLKNSIYRLKILALIGIFTKALNFIGYLSTGKSLHIEELFYETLLNINSIIELSTIAVFFLVISLFKKNKKAILWTICYIFIASCYVLYLYNLYSTTIPSLILSIVFFTVFLFTI